MLHVLEHSFMDSIGLLPFLFLTYLAMELLEHYTGSKLNEKIQNAVTSALNITSKRVYIAGGN